MTGTRVLQGAAITTLLLLGWISLFMLNILFILVGWLEMHAADEVTIQAWSHQITGTLKRRVFELLSSPSGLVMCFGPQSKKLQDYLTKLCVRFWSHTSTSMHCQTTFSRKVVTKQKWIYLATWKKKLYAYATGKAIEETGHTVNLIFTNRRKTMKTVNALVLKEEMDRKKADKQSMTRQEKAIIQKGEQYLPMWHLGIGRRSSIQVFDEYFHYTIHIKEASTFFARSLTGGRGPHELQEIHTIFSVCNHSKWYHVGTRDKES